MKTCESCKWISNSAYKYCTTNGKPPAESCPRWKEFDNQVWMREKSRAVQHEFEAAQRRQGGRVK